MLDLEKNDIVNFFDYRKAEKNIRDGYIASAEAHVQTPDPIHLGFPESSGECHIKSGYIVGTDSYVIKISSGFYKNPKLGLPSSNGMMLAFSSKTGQLKAILRDEGWLTDMRTAIGGALTTLALSRRDARRVLIIGSGIQARLQVKCLVESAPDREFDFYIWGRNAKHSQSVIEDLDTIGIVATAVSDVDVSAKDAEIIISTTPSKTPLLHDGMVQPGTHVTAIGADSPGKQELPTSLIVNAELRVCDIAKQSLRHGEFQQAAMVNPVLTVVELGDVLSGKHPGRASSSDITIADLTGIAAQDIAITQAILDAASEYS